MSERMIELQRQRMGLAPMAASVPPAAATATSNSTSQSAAAAAPKPGGRTGKQIASLSPPPGAKLVIPQKPLTPQQASISAMREEDRQMQHFLHCLQFRDDSNPTSSLALAVSSPKGAENTINGVHDDSNNGSSSATGDNTQQQQQQQQQHQSIIIPPRGPTVPTALSRRMLHRQGAGYLDDTVAAIVSASADQFLATVLQQAIACRDQRLKGAEMARSAARHRQRHIQHYAEDVHDRKRRKVDLENAIESAHVATIAAGDALTKSKTTVVTTELGPDGRPKKRRKKPGENSAAANGKKAAELAKLKAESDEESYDSIDEEEDYYQDKMGPIDEKLLRKRGEEEDDDNDMLILKDLAPPLQAWDFRVVGKYGLEDREPDEPEEESDDDLGDLDDPNGEFGNEFDMEEEDYFVEDAKEEVKKTEKKKVTKKKAPSPVPNGGPS